MLEKKKHPKKALTQYQLVIQKDPKAGEAKLNSRIAKLERIIKQQEYSVKKVFEWLLYSCICIGQLEDEEEREDFIPLLTLFDEE